MELLLIQFDCRM